MAQSPAQAARTPSSISAPGSRGPVSLLLAAVLAFVFATLLSWLFGIAVEIIGMYLVWPEQGVAHSASLTQESLDQLASYPQCALSDDTVGLAQSHGDAVLIPFAWFGALSFVKAHTGSVDTTGMSSIKRALASFLHELARFILISIYVAQNIAIRLTIVWFAAPVFCLLCLLAVVDGFARRDVRKWSGGRESSFVYHHAKKLTGWGLTGGFAIYLGWPFAGMRPVGVVLLLCAFAAFSMSVTVSSFKKYL